MEKSEKAKIAEREYKRKWREENREHLRQYYRDYREKNREKIEKQRLAYWERKADEYGL